MNLVEYINELENVDVNVAIVNSINAKYENKLPEIIKKLIANGKETVFLDKNYRVLSSAEIDDSEEDLHVQFSSKGMIPIIDCGENDFIVYHVYAGIWSRYNIIDDTVFMRKESLTDF